MNPRPWQVSRSLPGHFAALPASFLNAPARTLASELPERSRLNPGQRVSGQSASPGASHVATVVPLPCQFPGDPAVPAAWCDSPGVSHRCRTGRNARTGQGSFSRNRPRGIWPPSRFLFFHGFTASFFRNSEHPLRNLKKPGDTASRQCCRACGTGNPGTAGNAGRKISCGAFIAGDAWGRWCSVWPGSGCCRYRLQCSIPGISGNT